MRLLALAIFLTAAGTARAECDLSDAVTPGGGDAKGIIEMSAPPPGSTIDLTGLHISQFIVNNAEDPCVLGGTITGVYPRDAGWIDAHAHNNAGDAIQFARGTGHMAVVDTVMDNVLDAVSPPKDPNGPRYTWSVSGVHASYVRDDFVEDDGGLAGSIDDVLVDGTHVFISARPGRNVKKPWAPAVITVANSLVHLQCMPDPRPDQWKSGRDTCGPGKSVSQPFKWSVSAKNVTVDISDTIFWLDDVSLSSAPGPWPNGSYHNVTLIWSGPGAYPGPLPKDVTVTDDMSIWTKARQAWLARHEGPEPSKPPKRLPECVVAGMDPLRYELVPCRVNKNP